jgi:hypothetical protein
MHKQLRVLAIASPPDVEKLLGRLAAAGVNLGGAGGSNVEFGGEFAFGVKDGQEDQAIEVLERHHYPYRLFEHKVDPGLTVCWLEDRPGALHECIAGVAAANLQSGRIIRDVLIGVPEDEGIPVQIFSEEVRTPNSVSRDASRS